MKRKIFYGILAVLVLIQFIRPNRNISTEATPDEIGKRIAVPDEIHAILKRSCYDCHSNNTAYPWYTNVQPIGWLLQHHVNEGKDELNFSIFESYPEKRAKHKFKEIQEAADDGSMPITSYILMHGDTKLTPEQSKALSAWAGALK